MSTRFDSLARLFAVIAVSSFASACDLFPDSNNSRNTYPPHNVLGTWFELYEKWESLSDNALDSNGNVYVSGLQSGSYNRNGWLEKRSVGGKRFWRKQIHPIKAMAILPDSSLVVLPFAETTVIRSFKDTPRLSLERTLLRKFGQRGSDGHVVRLDGAGEEKWSYKVEGNPDTRFLGLVSDHKGAIIAFGYTQQIDREDSDGFVVKLSKDGIVLWTQTIEGPKFRGTANDWISSAVSLADGNIVFVGSTGAKERAHEGQSPWVFVIDSNGNAIWDSVLEKLPGSEFPPPQNRKDSISMKGYALSVTAAQNKIFVATHMGSQGVAWLQVFDLDGQLLFSKRISDRNRSVRVASMEFYSGEFFLMAGSARSTGKSRKLERDFWVAKFDSQGNQIWERRYGDAQSEAALKVLSSQNGKGIYLGGNHSHNRGPYGGVSSQGWLFRLNPEGYLSGEEIQKIPADRY